MKASGASQRRLTILPIAVAITLLTFTQRLPAPIQEVPESPTPAPKERAKAKKPQSKSRDEGSEPKTKSPSNVSATPMLHGFAGNWTGTALGVARTFPVGDRNNSTYSIHISADEKRISVEETRNPYGNLRQGPIACRGDGNSLAWNYEQQVVQGNRMFGRCTLRINSDGTAALADDREYRGWVTLVVKITATLTKQ
jgi:hypothetical protein